MQEYEIVPLIENGTPVKQNYPWFFSQLEQGIGSHKRFENFKPSQFDLENHLHFHVLKDMNSNQILTGCGTYNGGRFPDNVFRILNRCFVIPQYKGQSYRYLATQFLLKHQLQLSLNTIKYPFVSREGKNAGYFLNKWTQVAKENGIGDYQVSSRFFHVAPKGNNKKCFQKIAHPRDLPPPLNAISFDEWNQLP